MTQDERWMTRYKEVVIFIETNHRNPSKYVPEEKLLVHFLSKHSISKIKPRECPLIKFKGRSFFFFHDIIHDLCSNGRLRFRYFRFAVHLSPLLALC